MCGICGVLGMNDEGLVRRMCDLIRHRGPDDDGYYSDENFCMGMRRLAIIGIASGHQPIRNEDGTIQVVYNGEIYNFLALRADLEAKGHRFYTSCDTEVIPHLYEEYGDAFPEHLRGMFAISLWDSSKKRLVLVRDRLGIKPLYYTTIDGAFLFASEAKQFFAHEGFKPEMNAEAVDRMFTYRTIPGTDTMFRGVYRLLPGHMLVHEGGKPVIARYWDMPDSEAPVAVEGAYVARLRELLEESVRIRLMSEVPLGAYLSGGLDSSAIVAMMSRHSDEPVNTFTVGYGESSDEFEYARMVADHCGANHHEIKISMDRMTQFIPVSIWHAEVPLSDPAAIPFYVTSRELKKYVTVALLGEGSDELYAGYDEYHPLSYSFIPEWLRKKYFEFRRIPLTARDKRRYFGAAIKSGIDASREMDSLLSAGEGDILYRTLRFDVKQMLPSHQLLRVDKISMAHSIEARVPFLDHKLVEYSMSLPSWVKLNGGVHKYILKKAVEDLLPSTIIRRPKKGFNIPIDTWMEKDLKEVIASVLDSSRFERRGYFNADAVRQLSRSQGLSRGKAKYATWLAFMVEMWSRVFVDQDVKSRTLDIARLV
ncbi:asparagine synthase (glutamine-hydrolyzing) [Methanocella conradii HZ254]|uniref:Putative asparagine synthetase [glutamine-hydrolyzing] n=1 Tax=Methanocella conradii (strain DSM 24694 / JCM 17849 / CGMCC 1.5162 / HZ254) TaxID=1041930 RepID=H8I8B8_METCZ|nr:asparagine synthase (glutamine-hydrolyzing) [Methanocella conradii]AFC98971.1 asparagine synthase (glutamine-hydrolyzing) [Methanocella conradii HZ254]